MLSVRSRALLTLAATFAPATASASGFYIADIGTRGMGRAGAFVAAPDSLLAMHYNPAGLSFLRGLQAEASISLVSLNLDFQRACPCADAARMNAGDVDAALASSFTISNSRTPLGIPFLGVSYGFSFLDLTVGAGVWGPNSGRHDWGSLPPVTAPNFEQAAAQAAQRYSALQVKNLEANYTVAAAAMPLPGLRLGANLMFFTSGADQTLHLWANSATFASTSEDPQFDVPITFEFEKHLIVTWQVGASYELLPGLFAGASFRPARKITSDGTIDVQLPRNLLDVGAMVTGNAIEVDLTTAPIVRFGVQYGIPRVFQIEGAVVGELWSVHDRITVTPKDITIALSGMTQALGSIPIDRGWRDTFSFRIGGELNLFQPLLGLRGGYFFEPSAIPADRVDPSRVDLSKHGIALGASTELLGATLEVSAMYVALASQETSASVVKQKAPLMAPLGSTELVTTIGNGRYNGNYLIGSVSLSFALDRAGD